MQVLSRARLPKALSKMASLIVISGGENSHWDVVSALRCLPRSENTPLTTLALASVLHAASSCGFQSRLLPVLVVVPITTLLTGIATSLRKPALRAFA